MCSKVKNIGQDGHDIFHSFHSIFSTSVCIQFHAFHWKLFMNIHNPSAQPKSYWDHVLCLWKRTNTNYGNREIQKKVQRNLRDRKAFGEEGWSSTSSVWSWTSLPATWHLQSCWLVFNMNILQFEEKTCRWVRTWASWWEAPSQPLDSSSAASWESRTERVGLGSWKWHWWQ